MFRGGKHARRASLSSPLGYEAAGVIEEVGPGVTGFKPGDLAASIPAFSMRKLRHLRGFRRSAGLGDGQNAAGPILGRSGSDLDAIRATAYMMIEFGGLKAGDDVLITAAASSVGLAAIQIANAVGARPIATTRKRDEVQASLAAGAASVIDTERK